LQSGYPTLSLNERDRRWKRVRELMEARGLECLVVAGFKGREPAESYFSNEYSEGAVVFPAEGEPVCLCWTNSRVTRHWENVLRGEAAWIEDVRDGSTGPDIVAALREKGYDRASIGVVGLESREPGEPEGYIPYKTWSYVLEHLPGARFVDISQAFAELALVKSEEELTLVRYSAQAGEAACEAMLRTTRPGIAESEIYAAVMNAIFAHGANARYPTLLLHSGPENLSWGPPMWLHRAQAPRVVQEGDLVQAEIFPCYGGMETQQQMSIATKPVHPAIAECAGVARRSYEAGLKALRPGQAFRKVVEAMSAPILEAGLWTLTPLIHSMNPSSWVGGSGVGGTQLREQVPGLKNAGRRVSQVQQEDLIIKPGMVFELEPNACRGKHRVITGGTVVVSDDGAEELNKLATAMRVL